MPQILGRVLPHVGSLMDALFFTPTGAARDNSIGLLPTLPVPVNYPQYNSAVLLPLQGPDYSTKVKSHCSTNQTLHIHTSQSQEHRQHRIKKWTGTDASSMSNPPPAHLNMAAR